MKLQRTLLLTAPVHLAGVVSRMKQLVPRLKFWEDCRTGWHWNAVGQSLDKVYWSVIILNLFECCITMWFWHILAQNYWATKMHLPILGTLCILTTQNWLFLMTLPLLHRFKPFHHFRGPVSRHPNFDPWPWFFLYVNTPFDLLNPFRSFGSLFNGDFAPMCYSMRVIGYDRILKHQFNIFML